MTSGALGKKFRLQSSEKATRLSPWLPGIDMVGAREGFSWCCHLALLLLAAKLSHVGGDVDGLACRLC
jgi:hypothetical protein